MKAAPHLTAVIPVETPSAGYLSVNDAQAGAESNFNDLWLLDTLTPALERAQSVVALLLIYERNAAEFLPETLHHAALAARLDIQAAREALELWEHSLRDPERKKGSVRMTGAER